jgi:hypothetical protein
LIDFFGEILKIVKLGHDSLLRQVTGTAQTISELRRFLSGPPEECVSLIGEAIADYDPRCTVFAHIGNLRLPKTRSLHLGSPDLESGRVSGHAETRVTFCKRHSFISDVLFNYDECDPVELF